MNAGNMITFKTGDKTGSAYAVLSGAKSDKIVLMFHEWWGLNAFIKQEAESLQKELGPGVDVYAVDLYDGQVATESVKAAALKDGLNPERASEIIKGLLAYVGNDKQVATIGWCMGGTWSLQATLLASRQAACVIYYGSPEKDLEKLKKLQTSVLFIQGMQDAAITPQVVTRFSEDLKKLGKTITVKQYDAVHAFANPSNPKFNKEYAADAHKYVLAFLKNGLGLK
jgi:carboxymethylenebutenolidase